MAAVTSALIAKVRGLVTALGYSSGSNNLDLPGTLDVTGAATFDSTALVTGVLTTTAAAEINVTAPTLTVNAESSDTIAVDFQSTDAAAEHYIASLYDSSLLESLVGAFTLAETGAGAEVSTTARPRLMFTTSAAGAAQITVTDVATASGATIYLVIEPVFTSAETREIVPPVYTTVTFD